MLLKILYQTAPNTFPFKLQDNQFCKTTLGATLEKNLWRVFLRLTVTWLSGKMAYTADKDWRLKFPSVLLKLQWFGPFNFESKKLDLCSNKISL